MVWLGYDQVMTFGNNIAIDPVISQFSSKNQRFFGMFFQYQGKIV